jgi:hypothetical protein
MSDMRRSVSFIAALGDLEDATHHLHAVLISMHLDELICPSELSQGFGVWTSASPLEKAAASVSPLNPGNSKDEMQNIFYRNKDVRTTRTAFCERRPRGRRHNQNTIVASTANGISEWEGCGAIQEIDGPGRSKPRASARYHQRAAQ